MSLKLTPDEKENDSMRFAWITATVLAFTLGACGSDGPEPITLENGEACVADNLDEVCASDLCLEEFGDGVEVDGGMCTDVCAWNDDATDTCTNGVDGDGGQICLNYRPSGEFFCFDDCTTDADCRADEGWSCLCLDFFCGEAACVPDLSPEGATILEYDQTSLYDTAKTYEARK